MKKIILGLIALSSATAFAQDNSYFPTYKHLKSLSEISLESKFDQCVGQVKFSDLKYSGEIVLGKKKKDSPNLDYVIIPVEINSRTSSEVADTLDRLEDYGICPK